MTAPKPPTEAFDDQERELARILRALPAGEPSPALDARILRAAANAAASSRRPHARWLASIGGVWGIGAAAAAVLALGVSWQMLDPTRTTGERTAPVAIESETDSAVVVELGETRREPPQPMPGPPSAASPAQARIQSAPPTVASKALASAAQPAVAAPASDAPTAFPHDGLDEHVAARPEAQTQALGRVASNVEAAAAMRAEQTDKLESRQRKSADAGQDSPSAAVGRTPGAATALAARELAAAGARADAGQAQESMADYAGLVVPPNPASGPMKPATWLAQVRQLLAAHRTDEARASLKLFQKRYPNYVVPTDLAPLLRE